MEVAQVDGRIVPRANHVFQMLGAACDVFCPQRGACSLEGVRDVARRDEVSGSEMRRQLVHVVEVRLDKPAEQRDVFKRAAAQHRQAALDVHFRQRVEPFDVSVRVFYTRGPCCGQRRLGERWVGGGTARIVGVQRGQPKQDGLIERLGLDRLGEEIVHARVLASLAILVEGIGRERQDRLPLPAGKLANRTRRFQPVHVGHLHVHEDQVDRLRARLLDGFESVLGRFDAQADPVQQFQDDLAVDRMIFRQKELCARVVVAQAALRFVAVGIASG